MSDHNNNEIDYSIIFSGRRTISIIVSPARGVIVRAPYRTSLKKIEKFVSEKSSWIRKHLDNHAEIIRINNERSFTDGNTLPYLGTECKLRVLPGSRNYIKLDSNIFEIGLTDPEDTRLTGKMMDIWYRRKAEHLFALKLNEILLRFKDQDFKPSGLKIRRLKSRWGSCSTRGQITLNSELMKLDEKYLEYVIIHELCHLRHHNHSREYYALLSKLAPEYRIIRSEMRKFITR